METLGSLIDKLIICNLKIWHHEERRRDKSLPDSERLKSADSIADLNKMRAELVEEIDKYLASGNYRIYAQHKLY